MKYTTEELFKYWNEIPVDKVASYDDLCDLWNCSKRKARKILHELSLYDSGTEFVLIRSTAGGFFRTNNRAVINSYRTEVLHRAVNTFKCLRQIDRVLGKDDMQCEFDFVCEVDND